MTTDTVPDEGGVLVGPLEFLALALSRRRRIAGLATALALLVAVVTLLLPRKYTTEVGFVASGTNSTESALAGLGAQFGLTLGGSGTQVPDFYADLVSSDDVLEPVINAQYHYPARRGFFRQEGRVQTGNLADALGVDADTPGRRLAATLRAVRRHVITVSVDHVTGIIQVDVTTRSAELSEQVARKLLEQLDVFNGAILRTQAAAERRFTETQYAQADSALRAQEELLERFLTANRDFRGSPQLQFEYDRLQREIALRQQLALQLAQSYQQARISEVRDTPVISVVETPRRAEVPDSRMLLVKVGVAAILGGLLALLGLGIEVSFKRLRVREPEAGEAVREAWRSVVGGWQVRFRRRRGVP